jgi:uncharacterized membrane protein YagU involved in acid resistance
MMAGFHYTLSLGLAVLTAGGIVAGVPLYYLVIRKHVTKWSGLSYGVPVILLFILVFMEQVWFLFNANWPEVLRSTHGSVGWALSMVVYEVVLLAFCLVALYEQLLRLIETRADKEPIRLLEAKVGL